jgi:hypothetical protein
MGWTNDLVDAVRKFFDNDKDRKTLTLQKGRLTPYDQIGASYIDYGASGYSNLANQMHLEHDLLSRYIDYEEMDDFPTIASALDIYADDATRVDSTKKKTVWAISDDEKTKEIIDDLLHKTLRIEEDIWPLSRVLGKYGSEYAEVLLGEKGVVGLNFIPPPTMRRFEDQNGALLGFAQEPLGKSLSHEEFMRLFNLRGKKEQSTPKEGTTNAQDPVVFEPWEIIHWRLRSKHMRSIYGTGLLEPARWPWRRLVLLEDAVILHKLSRAPGRFAFYIDTGDLAPQQALSYVEQVKSKYKKKKFVDSNGKLDLKINPLCLSLDTKIPLLDGSEKTLSEMIAAHKRGEEQWVYSVDRKNGGEFKPGRVVWAGETKKSTQVVRVTLDNGQYVDATPDHKFIRRNGEYVEAQSLVAGDSLMPHGEGIRLVAKTEVLLDTRDTGTLTIQGWANFATSAGVVVKNSVDEDFWIPSRGGKESTRIDMIQGAEWQSLEEISYFREQLFAAIKVPATYMGVGSETTRSSLSQEDVRFASSVLRLQREVRNGIRKVVRVHFAAIGLDPDATEWDIGMTVPSSIFELAQMEVMTSKAQLAGMMGDFVSKEWILVNVFGFSEEEAKGQKKALAKQIEDEGVLQAGIAAKGNEIMGIPTQAEVQAADEIQTTEPDNEPDLAQIAAAKKKALAALDSVRKKHAQSNASAQESIQIKGIENRLDALAKNNERLLRLVEEIRPVVKHLKRESFTGRRRE